MRDQVFYGKVFYLHVHVHGTTRLYNACVDELGLLSSRTLNYSEGVDEVDVHLKKKKETHNT